MEKIVWKSINPDATHEKTSGLSSHSPTPIRRFPRSQKKRKFCTPYCRQYSGAQTISQAVHPILSHRGRRGGMARYCMRGIDRGDCSKHSLLRASLLNRNARTIYGARITSVTCWGLRVYLRWFCMGYQALLFCPDEKTARTVTQVLSEL